MKPITELLKAVFEFPLRHRQLSLMQGRRHENGEDAFVRKLGEENVEETVSRAIYRHFQQEAVIPQFVTEPEDSIRRVFGLADEDLEDFAKSILVELRLPMPDRSAIEAEPRINDYKCRDLAIFINKCFLARG